MYLNSTYCLCRIMGDLIGVTNLSNILKLNIENFRGIKSFSETFDKNFICLIGRGDSG